MKPSDAERARAFLDRPIVEPYALAEPEPSTATRGEQTVSVLVFESMGELLCLDTIAVVEAVDPRPVHRVTRRSNAVFRGLVNIHGQLELCGSLRGLFGRSDEGARTGSQARMLVLVHEGARWVIDVDRILGVSRHLKTSIRPAPGHVAGAHVERMIRDGERNLGYLDAAALFRALDGSLA